jgi:hypothetical protein
MSSAQLMRRIGLGVVTLLALAAISPPGAADVAPRAATPAKRACDNPTRPGEAACLALVRTDVEPVHGIMAQATPKGLGAADLQKAYHLSSSSAAGEGQTVAIVIAGDNPKAEADLKTYRSQYGLPPCTASNGCLRKADENGGGNLPPGDTGWGEELALDLDMVSAGCPKCHLLVVEASKPTIESLGTAVNTAVKLGAKYVSNSYGSNENPSAPSQSSAYFHHPGVAITAASGDDGYGVLFPASADHVTAVGGTSLSRAGNARGWTESAWSGTGSGCSKFIAKPSWQKDSGCGKRTVADVSAVADPATGVAVYDTFGMGGWLVVGGTSAATPLIAAVYALAGPPPSQTDAASLPYKRTDALNDATTGKNGTCSPAYLCTAGQGYDGPTGLGSPNGVNAFRGNAQQAKVQGRG